MMGGDDAPVGGAEGSGAVAGGAEGAPAPPLPPPFERPPGRESDRAASGENVIPFGPWSLSEVYTNGVWTGYGADCRCHSNTNDNRDCKRNMRFCGILMMPSDWTNVETLMFYRCGSPFPQ